MKIIEFTNPGTQELIDPKELAQRRWRIGVVLGTLIFNMIAVIFFATMPESDWRTATGLVAFNNLIFIGLAVWRRDKLMVHLLFFGLVLGVVELIADAWLVDFTGTLDYSLGGGPMIWRSPIWMPFAWQVLAIQLAVIGGWFMNRLGARGLYLAAFMGVLIMHYYESMALNANWWAYSGTSLVWNTPYFIVLGEFFIAMIMPVLYQMVEAKSWTESLKAGVVGGIDIYMCYVAAFLLISNAGL